jgi:cytoskeletal protein RodZ
VGAFGEKLRQRREQRGISLDAISTTTKISTRMLRAIEDEHFDQLPGGVFNKGFVRAYARAVGINEEEAISDYLAALRESQVNAQTILPNFRAEKPVVDGVKPSTAKSSVEDGSVARAEPVVVAQPVERRQERRQNDRRKNDEVHSVGRQEEAAEIASPPLSFLNLSGEQPADAEDHDEAEAALSSSVEHVSSADVSRRFPWERVAAVFVAITLVFAGWSFYRHRHSGDKAALPATQVSLPISAPATTITDAPSTPPKPALAVVADAKPVPSGAVTDSDVKSSAVSGPAHVVKAKPPVTFTLQIRASQTSSVSIMADGQPVAKETLIAPANTSVRAAHEIVVRTGNAGGIRFLLNGKDVAASGNEGEARVYTFDASGLRDSAPAANPAN